MIPYDGFGIGPTMHWYYHIRNISQEVGEFCECWHASLPSYTMSTDEGVKFKISCIVKTALCRSEFPKTEDRLLQKYNEMYGIKV
jgi:hypothetical protein